MTESSSSSVCSGVGNFSGSVILTDSSSSSSFFGVPFPFLSSFGSFPLPLPFLSSFDLGAGGSATFS